MSIANGSEGIDRTRELMMRALDREISDLENVELKTLLDADERIRAEWDSLAQVKRETAGLELARPPDEMWEEYMDSVYRRVERGIGWALLSVGAVVVLSYTLWQAIDKLIGDATIPWYVKGGVMALLVGIVILAVSVFREKYFVFRDDPYRGVKK
jgi:hypothetical protein